VACNFGGFWSIYSYKGGLKLDGSHHLVGFAVFVAANVQCLLGLLRPHKPEAPRKPPVSRVLFEVRAQRAVLGPLRDVSGLTAWPRTGLPQVLWHSPGHRRAGQRGVRPQFQLCPARRAVQGATFAAAGNEAASADLSLAHATDHSGLRVRHLLRLGVLPIQLHAHSEGALLAS